MHPIVTSRPGWAAFAGRKVKLQRAQATYTDRQIASDNRYRAAKAEYDAELHTLMLDGDLPRHDPPEPPKPGGDAGVFVAESQRIAAEEQAWLGRHARDLERELTERHDEVLAEAAALVAGLADCASELADIATSVTQVRAATGDGRPVTPGRIDPAALVRAVEGRYGFLTTPPRGMDLMTSMG